ncbi:hypothetical protein TRFO_38728 [Tritrichomonas foetus]|uniref:Protein kinase domain-containing protein n=1 Tax=Tritrichomonas foetus TaxID=1144522 RepID=A0A1J4J774_9EUKA|nr:hypothetical protein TRFO_38728 [Tritrichomonas foetus]|eukprot:OHS95082.1 hypothetical protein TRFO_38728 [Tritrichomonas foetus]
MFENNNENFSTINATLQAHKYRYMHPIGEGGFAAVHLVFHDIYRQEFVVKIIERNDDTKSQEIGEIIDLNKADIQSNKILQKQNSCEANTKPNWCDNNGNSQNNGNNSGNDNKNISTKNEDKKQEKVKKDTQQKFENPEIRFLMNLAHTNIIRMYEHFEDKLFCYIILEYCKNGSLNDYVKTFGPLKPPMLFEVAAQSLSALKYCHDRHLAHRDIKPANILLDSNMRAKLADFGVSCDFQKYLDRNLTNNVNNNKSTDANLNHFSPNNANNSDNPNNNNNKHTHNRNNVARAKFIGTKPYMSPEMFNSIVYDPFKADIWALGITFYYLACGYLPWMTDTENGMINQIRNGEIFFTGEWIPEFQRLIELMTNFTPESRPTVDDLLKLPIIKDNLMLPARSSASLLVNRTYSAAKKKKLNGNQAIPKLLTNPNPLNKKKGEPMSNEQKARILMRLPNSSMVNLISGFSGKRNFKIMKPSSKSTTFTFND